MPCIAIGPAEEDEDQAEGKVLWATSCKLVAEDVAGGGASDQDEVEQEEVENEIADSPIVLSPWKDRRVVFLEIDGILNTRPDSKIIKLEKTPCLQLRRLLDASQAEVVLTSRWRRHSKYIAEILSNFEALPEHREDFEITPRNSNPDRRDLEILQWINSHRDIAGWVALDARDLLRFSSVERMQGHTIQVNPVEGLTGDVVRDSLRLLGCTDKGRPKNVLASSQHCASHASGVAARQLTASGPVIDTFATFIGASAPASSHTPGQQVHASDNTTVCSPQSMRVLGPICESGPSEPHHDSSSTRGASSLASMDQGIVDSLRSTLALDEDLVDKMQSLLSSLPRNAAGEAEQLPRPEIQDEHLEKAAHAVTSAESRAEFEAVVAAARQQFREIAP